MNSPSPWGSRKLCTRHYKLWHEQKLDLSNVTEEPTEPIAPSDEVDKESLIRTILKRNNNT